MPSNSESIEIREASESDVPILMEMIREMVTDEGYQGIFTACEEKLNKSLFADNPVAHALIGFKGTQPVGFALYYFTFSPVLAERGMHLNSVYVLPEFRGKSYGRILGRHIVHLATELECARIEGYVVGSNTQASRFYKTIGAEKKTDFDIYHFYRKDFGRILPKNENG